MFKKGQISVNKGKTLSSETKLKISNAKKGCKGSNKGKIFDKEWKKNLRIFHIGLTDKETLRTRGSLGAEKRWVNHAKVVRPAPIRHHTKERCNTRKHARFISYLPLTHSKTAMS